MSLAESAEGRANDIVEASPPRLSVLQVVLSLNPGGTERLVIDIAKRLLPRVSTTVCCLEDAGSWAHELTDLGIPVIALNRRPGFHPSLGLRIADIATRHNATTFHCHQYSPFVYGRIAAMRLRGVNVVFTEHGRLSDRPASNKRRLVNQVLGRLPARIHSVSADLRRHMVAEGFPAHRVRVIYNGIEPGTVPTWRDRVDARRALGIGPNAFLFGTAARLDPVKNLESLIDAVALTRRDLPQAELVIIGDGPERQQLEARARDAGLAGGVHFAGYRTDVRRLLPGIDVYVNSSTSEGVSLTILEAMASARPVVATRVGGTPEVVVDEVTGLLVPARSPAAIAAAVTRLACAPEQRLAFGTAGRSRMETLFAVDVMVQKYLDAYLTRD